MLQGIKVSIEFKIQAALQPAALTAQFGLVDTQVLVPGGLCINTFKIGKPGTAT
jgi:hypothetical protein